MRKFIKELLAECILVWSPGLSIYFQAIEAELVRVSPGGLKYVGEYKAGRVEPKMDHLGCFCGKLLFI